MYYFYVLAYYLIGVAVSGYFIYYYRISEKTKSPPKPSDSIGALIGPWVFPLQIIQHFFTRKKK